MATFVLVHGSFHGGWCWEGVSRRLVAAGHTALAPDLPGMGADGTQPEDVSLSLIGDLAAKVARSQREKVILVGHSLGGIAISDAAEKAPENVAGLVYVTALLLPNGAAAMEYLGEQLPKGITLIDDGSALVVDPAFARERYYQGCEDADVQNALARLRPQPVRPFYDRLSITKERFGSIPRAFVECLHDKALGIELQRSLHAAMGCELVLTLATGHSPFMENPDGLARHLQAFASSLIVHRSH